MSHVDPYLTFIGPSRCFPFWQELLACYVVNTTEEDVSGSKKCLPALEDYYECLHHKKEVSSKCPGHIMPRLGALHAMFADGHL